VAAGTEIDDAQRAARGNRSARDQLRDRHADLHRVGDREERRARREVGIGIRWLREPIAIARVALRSIDDRACKPTRREHAFAEKRGSRAAHGVFELDRNAHGGSL
jgi:hypothetical protein